MDAGIHTGRREAEEPGGEMEVKLKQDHSTAALRPALRAIKCERVPGRARTCVNECFHGLIGVVFNTRLCTHRRIRPLLDLTFDFSSLSLQVKSTTLHEVKSSQVKSSLEATG